MSERDTIISRVKALREMRVDRGCTEAEARNASELASKLISKHGITDAELGIGGGSKVGPRHAHSDGGMRGKPYGAGRVDVGGFFGANFDWGDLFENLTRQGRVHLDDDFDPFEDLFDWAYFLPNYWVTKDGRRILISDMESTHLRNTIKLLGRQWAEYEEEATNATNPITIDDLRAKQRYNRARAEQMKAELQSRGEAI